MITTELTIHGGKAIACGVGINWSNSTGLVMDGEHRRADPPIVQQPVAQLMQIPWGHNIAIITKCQSQQEALYQVLKRLKQSSRRIREGQINSVMNEKIARLTGQLSEQFAERDRLKAEIKRIWQGLVSMSEFFFRDAGKGSQIVTGSCGAGLRSQIETLNGNHCCERLSCRMI